MTNFVFTLVCTECICHDDGTKHSTNGVSVFPFGNLTTSIIEGKLDPFLNTYIVFEHT